MKKRLSGTGLGTIDNLTHVFWSQKFPSDDTQLAAVCLTKLGPKYIEDLAEVKGKLQSFPIASTSS